jgi:uncharacterized membrane protein YvbJ
MKKCPYCAEEIQEGDIYCRSCGKTIFEKPSTPFSYQEKDNKTAQTDIKTITNGSPNTPEYIFALEIRIMYLEVELKRLSGENKEIKIFSRDIKEVEELIPNSAIVSNNFLTRAFAVWGHSFVAQLIISLVLGGIYLVLIALGVVLFKL